MGSIVSDERKELIPVSHQMTVINWVLKHIRDSDLFKNIKIDLNFLSVGCDCACIRLSNNNVKLESYVDGTYTGQIEFMFVIRYLNIQDTKERVNAIDLVNSLGSYLSGVDDESIDDSSIVLNSITQVTNAGVIFRDDSGIEDNAATFRILYESE